MKNEVAFIISQHRSTGCDPLLQTELQRGLSVGLSVCLSVCLLVTPVRLAKADKPIVMPFG